MSGLSRVERWDARLKAVFDEIDRELEKVDGLKHVPLHPVRPEAGQTSNPEDDGVLEIEISDAGRGIRDIAQAMQPFFTTQPEKERSGMGFSVMQTFMDHLDVESAPGQGTTVRMLKRLREG